MRVCDMCGDEAKMHVSMYEIEPPMNGPVTTKKGSVEKNPEADLCAGCAKKAMQSMMGKGAAEKPMSMKGNM